MLSASSRLEVRPVRLHEIVEVSREVAGTRSRTRKLAALADALRRLTPDEVTVGVAYLSGEPRQDRLDLGPAAIFGTEAEPAPEPQLELLETDAALQAIADVPPGTGSRTRRIELFAGLLERATADEQAWLRSLAVRELRQGALEGLLVQAIARAAEIDEATVRRAAMLSGDLRVMAGAAFDGGAAALDAFRLQVGVPLQPMLAATAADIDEAIGVLGEVVVEAKLDGARVQVHRQGDQVHVFTRNLNEVTARLPEVVAAARALDVDAIVLDGEAITFDADGRPRPFQDTMSRFGRDHDGQDAEVAPGDAPLEVRFFDVLHLDGDDVLDLPLGDRLERLRGAVPDPLRPDQLITADAEAARDFLRRTLAAGHEGVMVKSLDAPYEAGRRGAGWRKVKPVHTLDLVVLAAEWGSGRRQGWLSNLHLGARTDDGDGFVMLGKTFKGLTDELLTWQTEQLLERETDREGHIVHVRPELVVEIALDGVVRSTRYPGGLSLRFARVRGYRPDKDPADADTLGTVRAIHAGERSPV
jgi:DNA ligase 1